MPLQVTEPSEENIFKDVLSIWTFILEQDQNLIDMIAFI